MSAAGGEGRCRVDEGRNPSSGNLGPAGDEGAREDVRHACAQSGAEPSRANRPVCSVEAARMITACPESYCEPRHTKRERIALGVFACLLLVGAVALFSYINAGHGLNVAATSIDDIAGDMSGYGVILFEGTVDPSKSEVSDEDGEGVQGLISEIFRSEDEDESSSVTSEDSDAEDASSSSAHDAGSSTSATTSSSASGASRLGTSTSAITVEEAEQSYRDKGASTIVVDPSNLDSYSSGWIVMQGGRTYGIFSLTFEEVSSLPHRSATTTRTTTTTIEDAAGLRTTNTVTRVRSAYGSVSEIFEAVDPDDIAPELVERIESMLEHFEECGVDTVIALTPDPTPFCAVEGVDVVVTFKQSDRFSMSETIDGTMYFDAPEIGQVGVLMVAPGNVVSAKVMSGE